jgi:hypothetical protein
MFVYKVISGLAAMALGAAIVLAMPGFSPVADASTPAPLVKGDRLDVILVQAPAFQAPAKDCSEQAWPYYDASCLRGGTLVNGKKPVRMVTTDRVTGR